MLFRVLRSPSAQQVHGPRKRSDFTPQSGRRQSPTNQPEVNVNDRKQVIYKYRASTEKVEKTGQVSYTVCCCRFAENSYKSTRPPRYSDLEKCAPRQEHRGLETWRNEPALIRRRGIVFAASRCAGRDGAGTLRAAALLAVLAVKE
jgi:hypothetical protein